MANYSQSFSLSSRMKKKTNIARSEGEQIRLLETKIACLEVFALGGMSKSDDGTETGYFVCIILTNCKKI